MINKAPSARGFTLVETLTAVAIIGLILLLIGYEFDAIIGHSIHTRSNRDMETNARIAISKVTNRLRTASPWVIGTPTPAPPAVAERVILNPVPAPLPGATGTILQFYRVHPGSLANPATIPTPGNVPYPPYDIVTIQRSTCPNPPCSDPSPNYLVETATDAQTGSPSEAPLVLANDVTAFLVTATGDPKGQSAKIDVSLTVRSTSPKCGPHCAYTTGSSVWVGGVQINE
jgi:prepilin-type N-terminal cleavage/methylation domain-containing protein